MTLPATARFRFTADLSICRILNGMWQVSGAHGAIDPARAVAAMFLYHDAGFTTWDLADHYGPAEDFIGAFRRQFAAQRGAERLPEIQAFTKWVPPPGPMTRRVVEEAIGVSLRRMGTDCLDLLQFHWWDYRDRRYLDALRHLADLCEAGKIRHLALTNFDTERLAIIAGHGIRIVSNQVQYSLIDRRPAAKMAAFCGEHGITLLDLRHAVGRAPVGKVSRPRRAGPRRTRHRVLTEIQADDRRLGRLEPVPGTARGAEADRRQARGLASPMSAPAMCSIAQRSRGSSSARGSESPSTSPTTQAPSASRSTPTISPGSRRSSPNHAT